MECASRLVSSGPAGLRAPRSSPTPRGRESPSVRVASYLEIGSDSAQVIEKRNLKIDVYSEEPPIYVATNWFVDGECDALRAHIGPDVLDGIRISKPTSPHAVEAERTARVAYIPWDRNETNMAVQNKLSARAVFMARKFRPNYRSLIPGPNAEPVNFMQFGFAGEFKSHCDGICTRRRPERGSRVATLYAHCRKAASGGHTVFQKAGLALDPDDGAAVFFAFKGADDYMDHGKTEHAICPVLGGTKQVAGYWMRENLSENENWATFLAKGVV